MTTGATYIDSTSKLRVTSYTSNRAHAGAGTPYGQHFSFAMPESPMAEFWMGSDPGVPLEEVCPIPGMPMPKDGCVIPSDAPGFGMEIKDEWVVPWDHTVAMKGLG